MNSSRFLGTKVTPGRLEKIRLILSTYQDGTGQLARPDNRTLPGWRDFERAVALAFGGRGQESKAIYDVLVPLPEIPGVNYGIACKMRNLLKSIDKTGRVAIEVSNSSGRFWDALKLEEIDDYETAPAKAGEVLFDWLRVGIMR